MSATEPVIRAVTGADRDRWMQLFAEYREFYRLAPDASVVERVWGWLMDPAHELDALVAESDATVVGIADYRRFARPSTGTVGLWLDDLYTDPTVRGRGVGRALIAALQQRAGADGLSIVRWLTSSDNTTARRLYDGVATASAWVVYEAVPDCQTS